MFVMVKISNDDDFALKLDSCLGVYHTCKCKPFQIVLEKTYITTMKTDCERFNLFYF